MWIADTVSTKNNSTVMYLVNNHNPKTDIAADAQDACIQILLKTGEHVYAEASHVCRRA